MITQTSSLHTQKPLAELVSLVHNQHFPLTYAVFFFHMFSPRCQSTTLEEYNLQVFAGTSLTCTSCSSPVLLTLTYYYWIAASFTTAYSTVPAVLVTAWYSETADWGFCWELRYTCMQVMETKPLFLYICCICYNMYISAYMLHFKNTAYMQKLTKMCWRYETEKSQGKLNDFKVWVNN